MRLERPFLAAISFALLFIIDTPGISFAQTPPAPLETARARSVPLSLMGQAEARTPARECDIKDSLNAFLAIKDQASGRITVQPTEEFRLQKALLEKVIVCMGSETDAMVATLRDLSDIPENTKDIRDEFEKTLGGYRSYFDTEARQLREIPELKDVKRFAKDIFEWREQTYRPALQQMLALSYIVRGKESLKTASTRLEKINAALRTLGLAGNRELRVLLDEAAKNLKDANALNAKALDLFLEIARPAPEPETAGDELRKSTSTAALAEETRAPSADGSATLTITPPSTGPEGPLRPSNGSLSRGDGVGELAPIVSATSTDSTDKTAPKTAGGKQEPVPTPSEMAKESLIKIRDAYRLFINASEVVRRILN
ncbi:MAG: hypothetical protein Q8Q41_03725 [bacterium]|nr:hypothetical protein [bacterium]